MKKIVLTQFRHLEIIEAPVPVPGPGEAVIRIHYTGICGSDLHVYDGLNANAVPPLIMGHEGAGELVALNDTRTDVKVGDKVCAHTIKPCCACEACVTGRENLCRNVRIMGTNFDGVFTQYMLVDANRLIRFDDTVDDKLAALAEPLTVAVHDLRRARLQAGDNVLIGGAGPIGLIIGMMAKFSGAANVVLLEIEPIRIRMAQEMGFAVVNSALPDFEAACMTYTDGAGFDRAFEITSVQPVFNRCIKLLKKGGVMVQVGMPPKNTQFELDINQIIFGECDLLGVRHHTMHDMQTAVKIINSGVMNEQLTKLISAVYPMEQATVALERARTDKTVLRVLMDFT